MYDLKQLTEKTYYFEGPTQVGVYRLNDTDVCLIDSGNSKEAAKHMKRVLDAKGWNVVSVYCTHTHADHIGGNAFWQEHTDCVVYVPKIEEQFTRYPQFNSWMLYGANSPRYLKHKFFLAKPSEPTPLTEEVLPEGFQIIGLPGHSYGMVGFRTPDDVVFLADSLASIDSINKYRLTFLWDVKEYLETLENVKMMRAKWFVPAHATATKDIAPLAQYNIFTVYEIQKMILQFCKEAISFDTLLKKLFDHYHLTMNFEQYALVGSTLRSYLTWMNDLGQVEALAIENCMYWKEMAKEE